MAVTANFHAVQKDGRTDRFVEVAIKARPHNRQGRTIAMRKIHDARIPFNPLSHVWGAEHRSRRRWMKRHRNFRHTITHCEALIYRRAVKNSRRVAMTKSIRSTLAKLVNLSLHHGPDRALRLSLQSIADKVGLSLSTARKAVRWFQSKGWVHARQDGTGRGHTTAYVVDLGAVLGDLDPGAAVTNGAEFVTIDGETGQNKGCNFASPIKRTNNHARWAFRVDGDWSLGFLEGLALRLAARVGRWAGLAGRAA